VPYPIDGVDGERMRSWTADAILAVAIAGKLPDLAALMIRGSDSLKDFRAQPSPVGSFVDRSRMLCVQ
jgi:hypothetical protein